ncbi:hypothetical protein FKM82_007891 [Ascaphus truei]
MSRERSDPANPYHVNAGYVFAPATSANESECSSDALTDDSMSMTDSSVDGIAPYRMGSKKHLQREMHRNVKANGQVPLPHFPRTHRLPKEMTPVEPAAFAAELISRLEKVKQEQETMDSLQERLQQIKEEEEKEELDVGSQPSRETMVLQYQPYPLTLMSTGTSEDDPQAILDDHLSRVLKTPGCQSPGMARHSPRSRSPDRARPPKPLPPLNPPPCALLARGFVTKQTTKHVHHHYIHHHTVPKSKEQIEAEAARRVQCFCSSSAEYCCSLKTKTHSRSLEAPLVHGEHTGRTSALCKRSCKIATECSADGDGTAVIYQLPAEQRLQDTWQRIVENESERQNKHKPHSVQCTKNASSEPTRASSAERPARHHAWVANGHPKNLQPSHPLPQDPAVLPLIPPNTLAQLEEACRRLTEASKPPKPRCSTSNHQRSHSVASQSGSALNTPSTPVSDG